MIALASHSPVLRKRSNALPMPMWLPCAPCPTHPGGRNAPPEIGVFAGQQRDRAGGRCCLRGGCVRRMVSAITARLRERGRSRWPRCAICPDELQVCAGAARTPGRRARHGGSETPESCAAAAFACYPDRTMSKRRLDVLLVDRGRGAARSAGARHGRTSHGGRAAGSETGRVRA